MWILNLLKTVIRYRRFIILNTAVVTILAILIAFFLPREYKAKATILPPESQTSMGFAGLSSLSIAQVAQAVTNFSLPVLATPSDLVCEHVAFRAHFNRSRGFLGPSIGIRHENPLGSGKGTE